MAWVDGRFFLREKMAGHSILNQNSRSGVGQSFVIIELPAETPLSSIQFLSDMYVKKRAVCSSNF
jgi:hypothetical protein